MRRGRTGGRCPPGSSPAVWRRLGCVRSAVPAALGGIYVVGPEEGGLRLIGGAAGAVVPAEVLDVVEVGRVLRAGQQLRHGGDSGGRRWPELRPRGERERCHQPPVRRRWWPGAGRSPEPGIRTPGVRRVVRRTVVGPS